MRTPKLRTARLSLAPLRPADAAAMAVVLGDRTLHAFIGGEPLDEAALRQRFDRLVIGRSEDGREDWHNWIVRILASDEAVGTVQATVTAAGANAEIGYVIGVPWQGNGYASEAMQAIVDWLGSVGVATIDAHIHHRHTASEAVAERAGLSLTEELVLGERVWRRNRAAAPR